MNITFRKLKDNDNEYNQLYRWCQKEQVYEWFEQRPLSLNEIKNKYKNKINESKQKIFIIQSNNTDIGLVQIYKYENNNDIYEFDLFIGEENYINKGIGTEIVNKITNYIYNNYNPTGIILRPFKRNVRAIKCYQKCNYNIIDEYDGTDTLGNKEIYLVLQNKKN